MNVTAVSFHNEGKWLVTGSEDGTLRIWDLRHVTVPVANTSLVNLT